MVYKALETYFICHQQSNQICTLPYSNIKTLTLLFLWEVCHFTPGVKEVQVYGSGGGGKIYSFLRKMGKIY